MSVQTSTETLLVEVVGNQTNATAQNEETVKDTHSHVVLNLFAGEGTASAHQVHEADSNATVNVQDKVVLLRGGDRLDGNGVVEQLGAREVLLDELLDKLHTEIRVVAGLDTVTNTGDYKLLARILNCKGKWIHTQLVLLSHGVDKVTRAQALVKGLGELIGSTVKSTAETGTNGQQTRNQSADQVLTRTGGDDGVHGTRDSRTVVSSQHENHLKELACVARETAAEPQKRHDTTDTNVLLEDIRDGHTSVQEFLATVIGDGGDEGSRLPDETQLLSPRVVNGDLGHNGLSGRLDSARADQVLVDLVQHLGHVLKGVWHVNTGLPHGLVLVDGSLHLGVGRSTGVTELDLSLEHVGTGTNSPRDNGLGDGAVLNGLNDTVLLNTTDFTEQHENLALGLGLEAEQVVNESGTGVTVTTDGHTLVDTVRVLGDDVVQFVGHTTRLGDVANGSLAVELGGNNVVHHTTSVTDLVSTRLDTTNGGRTNDGDALLLGSDQDFTSSLFLLA